MTHTIIREDTNEALTFDVVTKLSVDPKIRVPTHPIEDGADVADHAEPELEPISLTGIVTATPFLRDRDALDSDTPQQAARDFFERAADKQLRLVTTRYGVIAPVQLSGYPHEVDNRNHTTFQVSLQRVRYAEATTTEIPPQQTDEPSLASGQNLGSQSTDERSPLATRSNPESVFFRPGSTKAFEGEQQTDEDVGSSWGVQLAGG